jgi:hypothetical protein
MSCVLLRDYNLVGFIGFRPSLLYASTDTAGFVQMIIFMH